MTAVRSSVSDQGHNEAAFDTCLAGALRIMASMEFSGLLGEERPTREMLVAFAGEMERQAEELAALVGGSTSEVGAQGRAWYEALLGVRDDPLQAAYHSLHAAAYLGLSGGMNTARVVSAIGWALRILAEREGRLTN